MLTFNIESAMDKLPLQGIFSPSVSIRCRISVPILIVKSILVLVTALKTILQYTYKLHSGTVH
jgi:hypothetical protein